MTSQRTYDSIDDANESLIRRVVIIPQEGRQLRASAAGVPCTILFDDTFRPAGASARLRRSHRPGVRGKRRQVAEQGGIHLQLAWQRRAAHPALTASRSTTASPRVLIWPQWTVMLSGATKVRTQVSATPPELDHFCRALFATCAPFLTFHTTTQLNPQTHDAVAGGGAQQRRGRRQHARQRHGQQEPAVKRRARQQHARQRRSRQPHAG